MAYQVTVPFSSYTSVQTLVKHLQDVYDKNGVSGTFTFQAGVGAMPPKVVFEREAADDVEYVLKRLPSDQSVTDAVLLKAVGEQLLAELTDYAGDDELNPLIYELRSGNIVAHNLAELRNSLPKPTLFVVTLPWNSNNAEEGDYASRTWAVDEDEALRLVAEEMADIAERPDDEREQYIAAILAGAGQYSVVAVPNRIVSDIEHLLKGPGSIVTSEAFKDFEAVKQILAKYGASV